VRSDEVSTFVRPSDNAWPWLSIAAGLALPCLGIYRPALQARFATGGLSVRDRLACAAVAMSVQAARERSKAAFRASDRRA